jgi:predicted O-methyltransferase YrrM
MVTDNILFASPAKNISTDNVNGQSASDLREKALEAAENIPGWLTAKEAGELFDLISGIPGENQVCCEIGSYMGKSSIVLGMALKAKRGGKLFCIDPFDLVESDYYKQASGEQLKSVSLTRKQFVMQNISKYGLEETIDLIQGFSHFVARDFHYQIDFIFIDGDHIFEAVLADFIDWSAKLKVGGVIAFHDYYNENDHKRYSVESCGPSQVIEEYIAKNSSWSIKGIVDNLFVAEKVKNKSLIAFSNGWHKKENWEDIETRWMQSDAFLLVSQGQDEIAELRLDALSFIRPRTLEVYSGDVFQGRWVIPTHFVEVAKILIFPGSNVFRLHVNEGCERPCEGSDLKNPDTRCLSLAIQKVSCLKVKNPSRILFLNGWHEKEDWSGIPTRWMGDYGILSIYSKQNCVVELNLRAMSFHHPRKLGIYIGNVLSSRWDVSTKFLRISTRVHLFQGYNFVKFDVPDGSDQPCNIPELNNSDIRGLSIAVQNIVLKGTNSGLNSTY